MNVLFRLAQKLRRLGKNCGNALCFVTREELAPKPATRVLLYMEARACPLASFPTKQLSSSSTDKGGKLRSGLARS